MEFQSMIKRSRWQKFSALCARLAVEIAKAKGDPTYAKYKLARDKFIESKREMNNRYRKDAFIMAKRSIRKTMLAKQAASLKASRKAQ